MSSAATTPTTEEGVCWGDLDEGDRVVVEYDSMFDDAPTQEDEGIVTSLGYLSATVDLGNDEQRKVEFPGTFATEVIVHSVFPETTDGRTQRRISAEAPTGGVTICSEGGDVNDGNTTEFADQIKFTWNNTTRRTLHEGSKESDREDAEIVDEVLSRMKTKVVIETVEEAEALRREIPRYLHDRDSWANATALHAFIKYMNVLDEELAERGLEAVESDDGEFIEYAPPNPESPAAPPADSWNAVRNA